MGGFPPRSPILLPVGALSRRILVVDDDPLVLSLVTTLLEDRGFTTASCRDSAEARRMVAEFDPDLAILDINLGAGPSGVQLGFVLSELYPHLAILYLTRYPAAAALDPRLANQAHPNTLISKDEISDSQVLLSAVEAALRGQQSAVASPSPDPLTSVLTRTQLEVLKMIAQGLTNAAIAAKRGTTERAVEKQIRQIYVGLGLEPTADQNARVLVAVEYRKALGDV